MSGITSWGIGCGTKDVPGVYADVAMHYQWIHDKIGHWFPHEGHSSSFSAPSTVPTAPVITIKVEISS